MVKASPYLPLFPLAAACVAILLPTAAPLAPFAPRTAAAARTNLSAAAAAGGGSDAGGSNPPPPPPSSDLKSLLPTPKKRTLKLDKFGRRVHDLTDDGTAKYSKGGGGGVGDGYAAPMRR